MWSSPSPKIHPKNPYLHVEWCAQNVYWKLAEDLGLPKEARKPHYLAEQRKNGKEREREEKQRNQDGTSTTKRKLSKKKGIWTLEGHPKDWKISRDGGGASKYQKKTPTHRSMFEEGSTTIPAHQGLRHLGRSGYWGEGGCSGPGRGPGFAM